MMTTFSGAAERSDDLGRGEVLAGPIPAFVVGETDVALLGEEGEQVVCGRAAERLAGVERQLEGRRAQVRQEDVEVLRVEPGLLGRAVEEVVGVARDEPVHGAGARDEDRDADVAAAGPPDPSAATPQAIVPG